jgi:hypothetical protein
MVLIKRDDQATENGSKSDENLMGDYKKRTPLPLQKVNRNKDLLILCTFVLTLYLTTGKGVCVVSPTKIGAGSGGGSVDTTFLSDALSRREATLNTIEVIPYLKQRMPKASSQGFNNPNSNTPFQPEMFWNTQGTYPWKEKIMTTTFWIGEDAAKNNPVPNNKSSWDTQWEKNFGGYDTPDKSQRIGFRPAGFIPRQNPFYIALPYNDIGRSGTKPEASKVIPWFSRKFERSGRSVIKGQWVAIHYRGRVCFAQWEDVGPFRTDHWEYVFGNERPSPNRNKAAGLDVSPAVRDYLGLKGNDYTDWKFVEIHEIPRGPWTKYGENNPFSPQFAGVIPSSESKTSTIAKN